MMLDTDLSDMALLESDEDVVFCPLCGNVMKETHRMQHEGVLWVFLDCSRLECEGKLTRKGVSDSYLKQIAFPFSTQDF